MIEINLSLSKKEADITNVAGMNLSLLNLKLVLIGIILIYTVEPIIDGFYQKPIEEKELEYKKVFEVQKKKRDELAKYDVVKQQVKELEEQQTKLKSKINVVKKIVEMRQNPFSVMKYIAENTPSNVWLTNLDIQGAEITLTGYSTSWKSIGDFIENLKSSIFFNGNITYAKPESMKNEIDKKRVESFEIKTQIVSY